MNYSNMADEYPDSHVVMLFDLYFKDFQYHTSIFNIDDTIKFCKKYDKIIVSPVFKTFAECRDWFLKNKLQLEKTYSAKTR